MLENYLKEKHAQYKKSEQKLTFSEWYILTGLIEKEIAFFEDEIENAKSNIEYLSGREYTQARQNQREDIKKLESEIRKLNKICDKLNY